MPNTSEAQAQVLIASLRQQPLLVVLRAAQPSDLQPQIERLAGLGVRHIEIAWVDHPGWVNQVMALRQRFGQLHLGAASVVSGRALDDVVAAGLSFAVSPVLDPELLLRAGRHRLMLVPGVWSPSEVHQARSLGCAVVKLFPAHTLGAGYWLSLGAPLGGLPFCIAAGGLGPAELNEWLGAGVDAVAIGGSLSTAQAWQELAQWLSLRSG
ncbi:MAG: bifunctional 4-hydroxy-2-oxoglutarate aldolase/2-dehydro-3-deoxy-phosphogluconate aldolase [Cyanobacteriota bacterium]|nr:bifunctional 4-hydroxy-2-oxoglutarate aldolase/2-dehydro-3-deoxy-phosphogluconate aldolase [Cyanobacteriota bacterium]